MQPPGNVEPTRPTTQRKRMKKEKIYWKRKPAGVPLSEWLRVHKPTGLKIVVRIARKKVIQKPNGRVNNL